MGSLRACNRHGIWNYSTEQKRCPLCTKDTQKQYDTHVRDKTLTKFYNSKAWRDVRHIQLSKFPLCIECGHVATMVDHVHEIKSGGDKLSQDNLASMCNGCHTSKTSKERKKRLDKQGIERII